MSSSSTTILTYNTPAQPKDPERESQDLNHHPLVFIFIIRITNHAVANLGQLALWS